MKKKRKDPSFDVMIRFFLQHYGIASKQDIDRIVTRMDRLEAAITAGRKPGRPAKKAAELRDGAKGKRAAGSSARMTATERVLSILRRSAKGVDVRGLKAKSGFEDKKIRNIIFRLSKEGVIKRVGRGVYAIH